MKKGTRLMSLAVIFLALGLFFLWLNLANSENNSIIEIDKKAPEPSSQISLECHFFDQRIFETGISQEKTKKHYGQIRAGIVPHDILAGSLVADIFFQLKNQDPSTIFIIGPNHYEKGGNFLLSSHARWQTYLGAVEPEREITNLLEKKSLVKIDDAILENDHSVAVLLPYLKYYLPEAKIVPLLASRSMPRASVEKLSEFIAPYLSRKAVIIGSVDFSHYLSMEAAQKFDSISLRAMEERNYKEIFSFTNDNLDSPASVSAVLMSADKAGAKKMKVLYHSNSEEIYKSSASSTTSYFEMIFY